MGMKPQRFEHVGIFVADMDRALAFYTGVMGLAFVERRMLGAVELGFLELAGQQIELIAGAGTATGRGPVDHVAFTVGDLDAMKAHVLSLYPQAEFEPEIALWDGMRCCFFRGPDGERLELFERRTG